MNDLNEHADIEHTSPSFEGDEQTFFACNFCQEAFESKRDLMLHRKESHSEKVSSCWQFSAGNCEFGEEKCWFVHNTKKHQDISSEYDCKLCDKVFSNLPEYLRHRKSNHEICLPTCKKMY